jgi:hypothetical protein
MMMMFCVSIPQHRHVLLRQSPIDGSMFYGVCVDMVLFIAPQPGPDVSELKTFPGFTVEEHVVPVTQ